MASALDLECHFAFALRTHSHGLCSHGDFPRSATWSAVSCEDNEPSAQTGRPGAVRPVRGLLGGFCSPAALFQMNPLDPVTSSYENGVGGLPRFFRPRTLHRG